MTDLPLRRWQAAANLNFDGAAYEEKQYSFFSLCHVIHVQSCRPVWE
jgi:hypothetical protein